MFIGKIVNNPDTVSVYNSGIVYDYAFGNSLCINEHYKTMHRMLITGFKSGYGAIYIV